MPLFEYTGLNDAGKSVKGMREADSQKALRTLLRKEGIFLTDVSAGAAPKQGAAGTETDATGEPRRWLKRRIKTGDVAIMTRQLATLIGAGIPLVEALGALVEQVEHPRLQRIVSQVKQRVNEGSSLADALNDHQVVFSNLYINMIRAGESAGALDIVLTRLADFTESQAKLRSKVVGSLAYPGVMVCVAIIIIGILFTTVIPKVTAIFKDMDVVLPIYTRILIAVSDFARDYWYVVVGMFVAFVFALRAYLRTPGGRLRADTITLQLPVLGDLSRIIAMSRFSRTLSTLLSSGVPLLTSMDIVKNILGNKILQEVIEKARDSIREGETIAAPLKRSGEFPPMVCHMIAVGERTGELESMLAKVADTYDAQVESKVAALTSLLEPVMIVAMGGGVAFIVAAILMPILQMNTFIKG
jgi:general secretion pathway protein F